MTIDDEPDAGLADWIEDRFAATLGAGGPARGD